MRIALVVFFLLFEVVAFAADSQPPPPSRGGKVMLPDSHVQKKNETSDHLKICAESLAAINKLFNAQEQEKTANKTTSSHKEESTAEWWKTPDIWVAVFTGILAVITGFLAYFTLMLWRATKAMVDEAALTSKRQADETINTLEISRNAANAAMEQAKTSSEALKRSNRAWIGVMGAAEIVDLCCDSNSVSCKIRLTIKNVGTSPALNTTGSFELIVTLDSSIVPRADVGQESLQMATNNKGITIIPGEPTQWSTIEVNGTINEDIGDVYVWLNGYYKYKDEFNYLRYSSFLFRLVNQNGDNRISLCNNMDVHFESFEDGWVNT